MYLNVTKMLLWLGSWLTKFKQQPGKSTHSLKYFIFLHLEENCGNFWEKTLLRWRSVLDCVLNCLHFFCSQKQSPISVLSVYNPFPYVHELLSIVTPSSEKFMHCSKPIPAFQSQMSRVMSDVRSLMAAERQHRQELEQAELEKRELMELLRGLQKDCRLSTAEGSRKTTNFRPLTRLESAKRKPREVTVI